MTHTAALAVRSLFQSPVSEYTEPAITALQRIEQIEKARQIARPMRDLFDMLAHGEVFEIDGKAFMKMDDAGRAPGTFNEWVQIGPAIRGWVDFWRRMDPKLHLHRLIYLADRLDSDKPLTPRLVQQAREEFEQTIVRLENAKPGEIARALVTTQIGWEMEKVCK